MADFRRSIIVLAAVALLLGTAGIASAQSQFTCTANSATPPLVRGEGITELTGDLLLTCQGGTATPVGVLVPTANIQIFLNTAITSRLLSGPNDEALLLVDDPQPAAVAGTATTTGFAAQSACPMGTVCPMYGRGATVGAAGFGLSSYDGSAGPNSSTNRNVFFGQQVPGNSGSIVWLGVPVDPPGTVRANRVFRITNVRANASSLIVAGPNQPPTAITSTVSISPPTALPLNNFSAQLTVGFAAKGLLSSESSVTTFKQCTDVNSSGGTISITGSAPNGSGNAGGVTLTEGFAQAFKVRNISTYDGIIVPAPGASPAPQDIPGQVYGTATETGFYAPVAVNSVAGLADFGTRLKIVFSNVPTGAHVYVPVELRPGTGTGLTSNLGTSDFSDPLLAGGSLWLNLVTSESGSYTEATAGSIGVGLSEVAITAGSGQAVYEVVKEDPSSSESAVVPVTVAYVANPGAGSPAIGPVATATASFAPISNDFVAEVNTVPVPRFVSSSTAGNLFSIIACATHLLYPFVTNQAGYDTGIAIANTSQDPYGTSTQTGSCVVTPFGTPTSTAFTTPADVAPGTVWANLVSVMFPGFQGYLIADCAFQYAHGFAFITKVGGVDLAEGYLALIIPDPPRSANPFPSQGVGSGEQLGY
ncbi:MAG TPA: hypothetical protein VNH83_11925 [Bryobacteraceae bacterium]|nr:hypothetical protein [Bryobacteraceae bacterium]